VFLYWLIHKIGSCSLEAWVMEIWNCLKIDTDLVTPHTQARLLKLKDGEIKYSWSMPLQFRRQKQFSLYYKCWKSRKSHFCFYCFLTAKQWIFYFFFHLGTISFCSLKKLFDLFLFVLPRQISKIKIIILNDVLKKKFTFVFFPFYLAIILS